MTGISKIVNQKIHLPGHHYSRQIKAITIMIITHNLNTLPCRYNCN